MLNETDFSLNGPQDVLPKKVPPLWWVEGTDRAVHGITFSIPSQFKSNFLSSYSGDWNLQRHVEQKELMIAGWKIHISPYIHDCQAVLEVIAGIAAVKKVTFKHVVSDRDYAERLSRQARRDIHGKFAATSSFGDSKEENFYNVIDNLKKQCIIVTKDFITKGRVLGYLPMFLGRTPSYTFAMVLYFLNFE